MVEPRRSDDYGVGTCWWISHLRRPRPRPAAALRGPRRLHAAAHGSTEAFDYSVYEVPRPIQIERPFEYFTPRVFLQTPV